MFQLSMKQVSFGVLLLGILVLASCGGSGGGGGAVDSSVLASVSFPPNGSVVLDSQVTLHGTTVMGGSLVRVNGIAASSNDGFMTWDVDVPLNEGLNDFEITLENGAEISSAGSHQLRYEMMLEQRLDTAAMGVDGSLVHFVRGETGDYILSRLNTNGSRNYFNNITGGSQIPDGEMVYDSARNRVALITGAQSLTVYDLLSESVVGVYAPLLGTEFFTSVELNPVTGSIYVATRDVFLQQKLSIFTLNPLNGDMFILTGPISYAPSSPVAELQHMSYDSLNGVIFAWNSFENSILKVEASVGTRDTVATGLTGYGRVTGLEYRSILGRIDFVTDQGFHVGVDRFTGLPTVQPRSSCDPTFDIPGSVGQEANPPYLGLLRDSQDSACLLRSDRAIRIRFNGDCDELFRLWRGKSGSRLETFIQFTTWDSLRKRLVVAVGSALHTIDPKTGDMHELPGPVNGFQNNFARPIRYDAANDRIYYISTPLTVNPIGGVYSIPAAGGEETLEVPLTNAFAAQDVEYNPALDEFLIVSLEGSSTQGYGIRRSDGAGNTISEQHILDNQSSGNMYRIDEASNSVFILRSTPAELIRLQLSGLSPQSLGTFGAPFEPTSILYDGSRDELLMLDFGFLRVGKVADLQFYDAQFLDGNYRFAYQALSVARDPESGMIYLTGITGRVIAIDITTMQTAFVRF